MSNFVYLKKLKLTMNLIFLSKISLYSVLYMAISEKSVLIYVQGSVANSYRLIYTYLERILIHISWEFHSLYNIFHKTLFKNPFSPLHIPCSCHFL